MQRFVTFQPKLFADMVQEFHTTEEQRRRAGKSVVEKLLKVRRSLSETESAFNIQVNGAIEEIRAFTRLSETQREEMVLYAIEKQQAWTFQEIIEETRMDKKTLAGLLKHLHEKKLIRQVRRHIIGSDRPFFMYKSNRIKGEPEAD